MNSAFVLRPFFIACFAIEAERDISSYDELVHEPIRPTSTFKGQSFSFATLAIFEIGVDISGEKGPFNNGSKSERFISITSSKKSFGFSITSSSMVRNSFISFADFETSCLPVAFKYSSIFLS